MPSDKFAMDYGKQVMEDLKPKPSDLDAIKKGLAPDGSCLIIEMGTGPETAAVLAEVAEAVEPFRDRGIIGCAVHREPGEERVFCKKKAVVDEAACTEAVLKKRTGCPVH
jgi:hypothetical protein